MRDSTCGWRPVAQRERCLSLDVIRGLALLGVLLVNLHSNFRVSLPERLLAFHHDSGFMDRATDWAVVAMFEFKAFTLFSFLFGAGLAAFRERAAGRGVSADYYLVRRLIILLAIGLTHLLLIWNGDILTLYAVCGFILVPLLQHRVSLLTMVGIAAMALPYFTSWELNWADKLNDLAVESAEVYAHGTLADVTTYHWRETKWLIAPLLVGVLPRTFGLMALGAAT